MSFVNTKMMENGKIEIVSEKFIEPFDKNKIYFVITNYGIGTNVTDEYDFWIDAQNQIHAKIKADKKVDLTARLVPEDYERESEHEQVGPIMEPSYDQWGRMGMIAGQTDFREKMFDRFTTAPQGIQIKTLIREKLLNEKCKGPNKIVSYMINTSFHKRDRYMLFTGRDNDNISSCFNPVVDNERRIISFKLKEKYIDSFKRISLQESGPDCMSWKADILRHDKQVALLGPKGNEFFAVVDKESI